MRPIRLAILALLITLTAMCARANEAARGWCEDGAQPVVTNGLTSQTTVQQSVAQCTVTVYLHGSTTPVNPIFSDNVGTVLSNPFYASSNAQWQFYAPNGRYDVVLSGGGLAATVTYSDIILYDSSLATSFYQTLDNNGTAQTQRPAFNLIAGANSTVICVDNPALSRTDCTFSASSTASTAWSAITPGTNNTPGSFLMVGNTLNLTGASFIAPSVGITLPGSISGAVTLSVPAAAGVNSIVFPAASGTVAIAASSPLVLSASGLLTCPTCNTTASNVLSVFGRTGAVIATTGDYTLSQITTVATAPIVITGNAISCPTCVQGQIFYQSVDVAGVGSTQRPALNFIAGSNQSISCVDNSILGTTDCTFTGSNTAATAWSAITASTNSNAGTFGASGNIWTFGAATSFTLPTVGAIFPGATSGTITVVAIATAGVHTLTLPATTGTVAVAGTAPVAVSALGVITCLTCATTTNGGALSGTAPVTISAAGVIACAGCATTTNGGLLTATSPVVISAAGLITCLTCATTTNGGALAATAPVTISAAGLIACATCATTTNGGALSAVAPLTLSAAGVISANKQGTDSNLLTSGTVSGTGSSVCTDANGGATTVCPSVLAIVQFNQKTLGANVNTAANTDVLIDSFQVTLPSSGNYRVWVTASYVISSAASSLYCWAEDQNHNRVGEVFPVTSSSTAVCHVNGVIPVLYAGGGTNPTISVHVLSATTTTPGVCTNTNGTGNCAAPGGISNMPAIPSYLETMVVGSVN
jgi:hypothetical protein